MTLADIPRLRLINQQIAATRFKKTQEIVGWLGAMQAQEFGMAKWAIGLRLTGSTDAGIEKAFNEGNILRTHLLRPTWHFVTPADIRLILALTAPRVHAFNASYYRKCGLDNTVFKRSTELFVKMLQGGKQLSRNALKSALDQIKLKADGLKLGLLFMHAELDGIICSGARNGNQFTYALLDERAPAAGPFKREEALAELARRYFTSRGPATLHDFVWWSGLTMKDARSGAAMLPRLKKEIINGKEYLFTGVARETGSKSTPGHTAAWRKTNFQSTFLLPDYDEYGISYKDRSALFTEAAVAARSKNIIQTSNAAPSAGSHMIVINGVIGGTWQRTIKNKTMSVKTSFFSVLNKTKQLQVIAAVKKYGAFTVGS